MDDWNFIKEKAQEFLNSKTEFTSFSTKRRYEIIKVKEDSISIRRIDGGNVAVFGKIAANKAIEKLKENKIFKKNELIKSVVRQTSLIYLHPHISWDKSKKEIVWISNDNNNSIERNLSIIIDEASDDDLIKIQALVNQRKHQSKFRKNLLRLYNGTCAISKTNTEIVLEAAHISPHAKKGINSNDNGILLRSDIHTLYDSNLILIQPDDLTIHIDKSLRKTIYSEYDGKSIANRIDGSKINKDYLLERWLQNNM